MTVPRKTIDRVGAALLVLVVVFAGRWSSYTLFRCRMDSIVRRACCCPPAESRSGAPARDVMVVSDSCCDVKTVTVGPTIAKAAGRDAGRHFDTLAPLVLVASLAPAIRSDDLPTVRERARGSGPPLILLNCSLLI